MPYSQSCRPLWKPFPGAELFGWSGTPVRLEAVSRSCWKPFPAVAGLGACLSAPNALQRLLHRHLSRTSVTDRVRGDEEGNKQQTEIIDREFGFQIVCFFVVGGFS